MLPPGSLAPDAQITITDREFDDLRTLIRREAGIALGDAKRHLVVARLARRLRQLGLASFRDYYDYVASHDPLGEERVRMVNCITTNTTEFFRERHHFDFLRDTVVAEAIARAKRGGPRRLRVWSAACSTGEEPYSIAMTLRRALAAEPPWDVRILATDVDTDALRAAETAIYPRERIDRLAPDVVRAGFLRGRGCWEGRVQVRAEVRRLVTFGRINFIEPTWPVRARFDAVFCRNALIYFDAKTQQSICRRLIGHLEPHGHFFVGHSESLFALSDVCAPVRSTIYAPRAKPAGASHST